MMISTSVKPRRSFRFNIEQVLVVMLHRLPDDTRRARSPKEEVTALSEPGSSFDGQALLQVMTIYVTQKVTLGEKSRKSGKHLAFDLRASSC